MEPARNPPRPRSARSLAGPALVAASALIFVSCGGGPKSSTSASVTPQETATTDGQSQAATSVLGTTATSAARWTTAQQEVILDFVAARRAFSTSLQNPNPDDPQLPATHVDPMLAEVRKTNAQWQAFGQAGRFPANSVSRTEPLTVEINGDAASIETCGVDDSIIYQPATGKVLNSDVVTVQATSTMARTNGRWMLQTRTELHRWEGVAGCALDFS